MKKTRDELKLKFQKNSKPNQQDFEDVFDSLIHKDDALPNATLIKALQLDAEQGVDNAKYMTPLRTFQAIKKLVRLSNLPSLKEDIESLINSGAGQPAFSILTVDVVSAANKLKATVVVSNALNLGLQYSIDDANYQTSNVFENLTFTNWFYVRQANNFSKKVAFQKKTSILPTISTLDIVQTGGNYSVTINANNPNTAVLEYKLDTGVWQDSNVFTLVSAGTHTFSLRNKAAITEGDSVIRIVGQTNAPMNVVPKLTLTPETMWNRFSPNLIPDFVIPTSNDTVLGRQMPVKWFVWDAGARNNYGTSGTTDTQKALSERTNMFNKGITAIDFKQLRDCLEKERDTAFAPSCYVNGNTPVVAGHLICTGASLGGNGVSKAVEEQSMSAWIDWGKNANVVNTGSRTKTSQTNNKYDFFLTLVEYYGYFSGGTSAEAGEFLTALNYAILDKTNGYVGQVNLNSILSLGIYINEDAYNGNSRTPSWSYTTTELSGVYQNKKNQGNPKILSVLNIGQYFESFLPQGYQVKDQNGNNWFTINHFGGLFSAATNYNSVPNINHWAATVGGLTEASYEENKAYGNKLLVILENTCRVNGGYWYHPNMMQFRDNKYIQEYNRYGNLVQGSNGDYLDSNNSEVIPNFMAEGQIILAFFCGAKGVKFVRAGSQDSIPHTKDASHPRRGTKYNDPDWGNEDYENNVYTKHALWRLGQKVQVEDGNQYSFFDICDDSEVYMNMNTEVNYGSGYVKYKCTEWAMYQKTGVRAVVNLSKNVIFILAFQPYGNEQSSVTVRYNLNGKNFMKIITVPVGQIVIEAYNLS